MRTQRLVAVSAIIVTACSAPSPVARQQPPATVADVRAACIAATGAGDAESTAWRDGEDRAEVRIAAEARCRRTYALSTTAPLRDKLPANPRTVVEQVGAPIVRTNNIMFDALYALALDEAREASVASIRDDAFNSGKPTQCPAGGCYETGRLWTYVWTRDTSYATDLGLATLDPIRARNSMEFKLSERRGGGGLSVVQDTGSGGSWPISTDRVVWALGARALLRTLDGTERAAFAARALEALANTIEHDRAVAFDAHDGLYLGETSFLDWREQTYPMWAETDTIHIGTSTALSTNALHVAALELAAELAHERGDSARSERWRGWATDLRAAIRRRFWLEDRAAFAAFTPTFLDPAPSARHDLLGTALAILLDIAEPAQARAALAAYPHVAKGPPVVWPPERSVPVYHNRALWPFVTAYELRAARKVRNDRVATLAVESLVRGAALNLSNMENFEMISGRPETPEGPVINSQRQLWSVAGYVAMVHDVVFGIEPTGRGLRFAPYITKQLRHSLFRGADSLVLAGYPYRGRHITVTVRLPARGADRGGAYAVGTVRVDDRVVADGVVDDAALGKSSQVVVDLVDAAEPAAAMRIVERTGDEIMAPAAPMLSVTELAKGRGARLTFPTTGKEAPHLVRQVYRDGSRVGSPQPATSREWIDRDVDLRARTACWSAETIDTRTREVSHRSQPACLFGRAGERVQTIGARTLRATGGALHTGARAHVADWGDAGHRLEAEVTARYSGEHLVQLVASNGSGPINTGVTCAIKQVVIDAARDGAKVGEGHLVVPHGRSWDDWRDSSFVRVRLVAGQRYRIRIGDAPTAVNMSAFEHFVRYTRGTGGAAGPVNRMHVAELRLIAR